MNDVVAFNTLVAFLSFLAAAGGCAVSHVVRSQSNRTLVTLPFILVTLFLSVVGFYNTHSFGVPYGSSMAWYFFLLPPLCLFAVVSVFNWKRGRSVLELTEKQSRANAWRYVVPSVFALVGAIVFFLSKHYVGNDEGSYVYEIQLMSQGLLPFKDFISRAPTEIAAFLLFSKVFGASIISLKVFNALIVALIGFVSYCIVSRFQKPSVALAASVGIIFIPCFFLTKLVFSTAGLSSLLILSGCLFIILGKRYADVLAGIALALAVFTRESGALFVFGLLLFLLFSNRAVLARVVLGGLLVSAPTLAFFGSHIGLQNALDVLLGLGHVGVEESQPSVVFSLAMVWFFSVSVFPFLFLFASSQKRPLARQDVPLLMWIVLMGVFYGWYLDKRAFMLSYGSEFVPLIGTLVFSLISLDHRLYAKKYLVRASVAVAFLLLLAPYAFVGTARGNSSVGDRPFPIDRLIGSGIPLRNFNDVNSVIRQNVRDGDVVFAGNLAFASENGLAQFMDISRPMAYEGNTKVYELYGAPSKEEIVRRLFANPPRVIISDHHMVISFLPDIQQLLDDAYMEVYSDDFARVFVLGDN